MMYLQEWHFSENSKKPHTEQEKGKSRCQLFGDFCEDKASEAEGRVTPQMKGAYHWTNLRPVFPEVIADSLEEGIRSFDRR